MHEIHPPSAAEYIRFLPEIILTIVGVLVMVLEAVTNERQKRSLGFLALAGVLASMLAAAYAYGSAGQAFQNMITVDGYGTFFIELVLAIGCLTLLASFAYLKREGAESGEFYSLILFSLVGQCILATANDLIMVFIGLEVSSIATYILAGYLRDDRRNNESALKYFLLGSFATAFMLYGIAWVYGLIHSTNLDEIRRVLAEPHSQQGLSMVLVGVAAALIFVGLAFKVSAAPFQSWAPDVYQGAAAPVSAFMSAAPKAAAFAVFFRVFITAFGPINERWEPLVWACALLTMFIGNFAALTQTNVKRLLGYSSIAHAGYVLVALTAYSTLGISAAMFYLASYALMNVGAFAVVSRVASRHEKYVHISDLAGLARREPATAALLTVFVLSLIGVPLTGGFFAKFYVFRAALDSHLIWLTILGLLNSAVAAYYYLKILVAVYMQEPGEATNNLQPFAPGLRFTIWAAALGTLVLGIFPSTLLTFVSSSAAEVTKALTP
ncbi:MAG: NADH-quinone oxidoreductase subunit N [Bryobacteraceae bacterium]